MPDSPQQSPLRQPLKGVLTETVQPMTFLELAERYRRLANECVNPAQASSLESLARKCERMAEMTGNAHVDNCLDLIEKNFGFARERFR
jgi:hypothetical protein